MSVIDTDNILGMGALQIPTNIPPKTKIVIPFQLEFKIKYPNALKFGMKAFLDTGMI